MKNFVIGERQVQESRTGEAVSAGPAGRFALSTLLVNTDRIAMRSSATRGRAPAVRPLDPNFGGRTAALSLTR